MPVLVWFIRNNLQPDNFDWKVRRLSKGAKSAVVEAYNILSSQLPIFMLFIQRVKGFSSDLVFLGMEFGVTIYTNLRGMRYRSRTAARQGTDFGNVPPIPI